MQTVTADNLREELDSMVEHLSRDPFQAPLEDCAQILRDGFEDNIQRAEDSQGSNWPPHAPATVKQYGPHPLLILSEYMLESLRTDGAPSNITRIDQRELQAGTDAIYAATHQYGDDSRNIPQREFVYATEDVLEQCEQAVAIHAGQLLGV